MPFYKVLYINVKEDISFSKYYRYFIQFVSWVLVYRSNDGPKKGRN